MTEALLLKALSSLLSRNALPTPINKGGRKWSDGSSNVASRAAAWEMRFESCVKGPEGTIALSILFSRFGPLLQPPQCSDSNL